MSIHVTTGNRLDVVYTYEKGEQIILGLERWDAEGIIPLPNPEGLATALIKLIAECAVKNGE